MQTVRTATVLTALLAVLVSTGVSRAQPAGDSSVRQSDAVRVELLASQDAVRPGDTLKLAVRFSFRQAGLHAYGHDSPDPSLGTPTTVTPAGPQDFAFGQPVYPASEPGKAGVREYRSDFAVLVRVQAPAKLTSTSVTFALRAAYGICAETMCLDTATLDDPPLTLTLPVRPAGAVIATSQPELFASLATQPAQIAPLALLSGLSEPPTLVDRTGEHWTLSLLVSLLVGLALNLTPCVLPIIPLTVGYFVYQAQQLPPGRSRRRSIAMAGVSFAGGMLVAFVVLGGLVVLAKSQLQVVFQHPGAVLGLGLFVVTMALGMFGVYPVQLPGFMGRLAGGRSGVGGAFLMGALAAVMSTPCTGPFLGSMIGWALRVPAGLGLAAFVGIGIGMASPYLLLTAAPGLLDSVPRSGKWTERVKTALGFVLLAAAVSVFSGLRSQPDRWLFALWASMALSTTVWVAANIVHSATGRGWVWPVRIALLAAVLAGIGHRWPAEQTQSADARESVAGPIAGQAHRIGSTVWYEYDPDILGRARKANLPVMLDFVSDNCHNCVVMHRAVWPTDQAASAMKGILPVRVNTSRSAGAELVATYRDRGAIGTPTLVFLDARGEVAAVFSGIAFYNDPNTFARAVEPVRAKLGL